MEKFHHLYSLQKSTMFGTGQLPKFENDQFEIKLDDNGQESF